MAPDRDTLGRLVGAEPGKDLASADAAAHQVGEDVVGLGHAVEENRVPEPRLAQAEGKEDRHAEIGRAHV